MWSDGSGPIRSLEIGLLDLAPGRVRYGTIQPSLPSAPHRQGAQISPGRCANCRCTSAAFTVGCVAVGFAAMCHRQQHPSALTMRFAVRRLAPLHSGFLQTNPRGAALVAWVLAGVHRAQVHSMRLLGHRGMTVAPTMALRPAPLSVSLCASPGSLLRASLMSCGHQHQRVMFSLRRLCERVACLTVALMAPVSHHSPNHKFKRTRCARRSIQR